MEDDIDNLLKSDAISDDYVPRNVEEEEEDTAAYGLALPPELAAKDAEIFKRHLE